MNEVKLSQAQIKNLIGALSVMSQGPVNPFDIQLQQTELKLITSGIAQVRIRYRIGYEPDHISYELGIGYLEHYHNHNPETIELYRIDREEATTNLIPVGRLAYVSDKLREYGVW